VLALQLKLADEAVIIGALMIAGVDGGVVSLTLGV
jgi:hypothetical protein